MGHGASHARGDDEVETGPHVALDHVGDQLVGNLGFGDARLDQAQNVVESIVGNADGVRDQFDLVFALDHPERFYKAFDRRHRHAFQSLRNGIE